VPTPCPKKITVQYISHFLKSQTFLSLIRFLENNINIFILNKFTIKIYDMIRLIMFVGIININTFIYIYC